MGVFASSVGRVFGSTRVLCQYFNTDFGFFIIYFLFIPLKYITITLCINVYIRYDVLDCMIFFKHVKKASQLIYTFVRVLGVVTM